MKITIHLLGQARQLAARGCLEVELPDGACVNDTLPPILEGADARLATLLSDDEGRLRRSVMVVLRNETIDASQPGLLRDGDELSLLPPMSGG